MVDVHPLPSGRCGWEELAVPFRSDWLDPAGLELREDWTRRWTTAWKYGPQRTGVICPVRDDIRSQHRIPKVAHAAGGDHRSADQITRHAISILTWARATSSEPLLAPLLARYRSTGETQYARQLAKSVRMLKNTTEQRTDSTHGDLTTALDDFADKLVQTIDAGMWPPAN